MHLRVAALPSKCACFRSCREEGRRATGFWRRGKAGEERNCGEKGDLGRQPDFEVPVGRRAGMAPIAGLCRGQGKGSTVRLRDPNTACTVRQGKGKGKGQTRFARTPRVSQPAEPSQLRLGAIIPVRFPLAGGQAEGRCPIRQGGRWPLAMPLTQPLIWCLVPDRLCRRTWHLEPVLRRAQRSNSRSGRRAPLGVASRLAGTHQRCIRLRLFWRVVTRLQVGVSLLWADTQAEGFSPTNKATIR